jgi:serine/threonine-protein kinase
MTTSNKTPSPGQDRLATAETFFAAEDAPKAADAEARTSVDGWLGQVIDDRYRIIRALGEGGMGAVFVAEHLKLGNEVAFKIVQPELASQEQLTARFAREAMASARLNHPHVASALDYGSLPDGGAYLVMQLARGRSLRQLLDERTALPWPMACEIAAQIADAAAAAHAVGIVHRDLKPDNVFVEEREDGTVLCQVLDFGIARINVSEGQAPDEAAPGRSLTQVGTVMGTPGYMAPEQAMGRPADPRADLYALGVMLVEMITGAPLFDGETLTAIVTEQLTGSGPIVAERSQQFNLPSPLEALLGNLLAPEPTLRPNRAADVRDELRAVVRGVDPTGATVRRTGEVPAPPAEGAEGHRTAASPFLAALPEALGGALRWRSATAAFRRMPRAGIAAGVALMAILTVGIVGASGSTDSDALTAQEDSGPSLDAEGRRQLADLIGADDREVRRAAAESLLTTPADELPPMVQTTAELELARGCRPRKDAIIRLGEIGDARALPALERLADTPRRGCGFLGSKDCLRCLRDDLDTVIAGLRGTPAP